MTRCINIDWLECYCLEDPITARDDYWAEQGIYMTKRPYGTKHMTDVLTIYDKDFQPFCEIRRGVRHPEGGHHAIYPDGACYIRLVNRYCYHDRAASLIAEFIYRHRYQYIRIYRLDLCCDLVRFDSGDFPDKVARRIVNHVYAKVYQARRTVSGNDQWNMCEDNYLRWGKKGSMVATRFYNKSLEMREEHKAEGKEKPWIIQAWLAAGLIDNPVDLTVNVPGKGYLKRDVWRLEFQINSSAKNYYQQDREDGSTWWVEHSLDAYAVRAMLITPFQSLVSHYFSFRIYKQGVKKYDCPIKVLFKFSDSDNVYTLRNESDVARTRITGLESEIKQVKRLVEREQDPEVKETLQYAYDQLAQKLIRVQYADTTKPDVVLQYRMSNPSWKELRLSSEQIKSLFDDTF